MKKSYLFLFIVLYCKEINRKELPKEERKELPKEEVDQKF